jgi:uncharacterized protein YodC (DUF2158 family)
MMKDDNGSIGVGFVTLVCVLWVIVGVIFVLGRVSNTAHYNTTTICSVHYSATDGEYRVHTADTGDYHFDHQLSDQESSTLYRVISAHIPGTYSIKWYSNVINGSQALHQATLLPTSAQQNICSAKK